MAVGKEFREGEMFDLLAGKKLSQFENELMKTMNVKQILIFKVQKRSRMTKRNVAKVNVKTLTRRKLLFYFKIEKFHRSGGNFAFIRMKNVFS